MKEFLQEDFSVKIQGQEYKLRELSLAQKIKILNPISSLIQDLTKHMFFKKSEEGKISFNFFDEVSLAELNIDKIILGSIDIIPVLLEMSIPDFKDWENLPESQTREALSKIIEINDFKGFIANFISLAAKVIH